MKKKFQIILLLVIACINLRAQITFQKTFGGTNSDYPHMVIQTSDGGYIMSGVTWSFGAGNRDAYLSMYNQ